MANAFDAITSMLESAGSVSNTINKHITNEAKLSTQTKNIQLQSDINGQLARIKQDNKFENWNTEMNQFFEQIKGEMANPDSPYYCRNNLQAQMFNEILSQNQVNVSNHVNNLVIQEQQTKNKIDINNSFLKLQQSGMAGQEYYNAAMELVNSGNAVGVYSQAEYEQMNENAFYTGYTLMYENMFDDTVKEAIRRGDSSDAIWDGMQKRADIMMKVDANNMPAAFDKESYDKRLKQDYEKRYKAIQQDIWNNTEKKFANYYDSMLDQRTVEGHNRVASQARLFIDSIKETGEASPDQITKWTGRFVLEDYLSPEGTTTKAQANAAAKKMKPEDLLEFTLNAVKRGDESELGGPATYYDAWEFYQNRVMEEYTAIPGNENASWMQLEKEYPVVGKFFEYAEKNLPDEMKDVVSFAENTIKSILNTKDNKDAYKEEYASTMNWVKDLLFETNVSDLDKNSMEALKKRVILGINSNLGGVLEKQKQYKEYFEGYEGQKTLSDYREGAWGKEKRMAQAMQERDANPDLVYTNQYGVQKGNFGNDVQQGLTRLEADERAELVKIIKNKTGKDIPAGAISATWENEGTHDITARKIYTIDGVDYRFRSDDGKHIILEEKKNGTTQWTNAKTDAQQKKYDSVEEQAKRAVKSKNTDTIPEGGFTYEDDNGKVQKFTYTDPEGEEKVITQAYWKRLRSNEKQRIIKEFIEKNPEAAQRWINSN